MATKTQSLANDILFAALMGALAGFFGASIYTTFHKGFSKIAMDRFDLLAFWYRTPFMPGYSPAIWITGLQIIAGAIMLMMVLVLAIRFRKPKSHHGTARWVTNQELAAKGYMKAYKKITGPIFGKSSAPKSRGNYLTNGDMPHSLVVAPTRAGKGVGVVIPTLLTFDGSVVALDVKGELFELTSRARLKRGDRVYKFSPLDRNGRTHCYNPVLDIMAAPPSRRFLEARRLAANLIVAKGKGAEGFLDGARDLFVAGILACIERGTPTIGAVYDLFAMPGEKYKLFAQLAEESKNAEAQRIFDNMASNDTKIITSYTSVLGDGGLNLWADGLIKAATSRSDFSIYDLRRDPATIYLVVSPNDLEVVAPLVRLFFQQLVSVLQRDLPAKDETFEILFLLDEFKHLGKMEAIETAITTIAGYKARFMFIIQSLAALTANYEQPGKENFLGNTGIQVFMATADEETPQYISKAIGDYTYESRSKSWSFKERFNTNIQASSQGATLIRPEQVRILDENEQIVLIKGLPPARMPKVKYYSDRILSRIFNAQVGPLPEPPALTIEMAQPVYFPAQQDQATAAQMDQAPTPGAGDDAAQAGGGSGGFEIDDLIKDALMTSPPILMAEPESMPAPVPRAKKPTNAAKKKAATDTASKKDAMRKTAPAGVSPGTPHEELLAKIIALQSRTRSQGENHV